MDFRRLVLASLSSHDVRLKSAVGSWASLLSAIMLPCSRLPVGSKSLSEQTWSQLLVLLPDWWLLARKRDASIWNDYPRSAIHIQFLLMDLRFNLLRYSLILRVFSFNKVVVLIAFSDKAAAWFAYDISASIETSSLSEAYHRLLYPENHHCAPFATSWHPWSKNLVVAGWIPLMNHMSMLISFALKIMKSGNFTLLSSVGCTKNLGF